MRHKSGFRIWGWAFLLTTLLSLPILAAASPQKIRLLIVEGVSNHHWQHRLALVQDILARDGSFEVDVSITPAEPSDPGWANWRPEFSKYDAVLSGYNNLGGKAPWPAEVQRAFEQYVRRGGGFYVVEFGNSGCGAAKGSDPFCGTVVRECQHPRLVPIGGRLRVSCTNQYTF